MSKRLPPYVIKRRAEKRCKRKPIKLKIRKECKDVVRAYNAAHAEPWRKATLTVSIQWTTWNPYPSSCSFASKYCHFVCNMWNAAALGAGISRDWRRAFVFWPCLPFCLSGTYVNRERRRYGMNQPEKDGFVTIHPKLDSDQRECHYCKANNHYKQMHLINGHWWCNKGHYTDYVKLQKFSPVR